MSITGGAADLIITNAGFAGVVDATATLNVPGFNATLPVSVQLNTIAEAPVTLTHGGGPITLPAGPYVKVETTSAASITLFGQTLTGNFVFEQFDAPNSPQSQSAAPKIVRIAATGVSLDIRAGKNPTDPKVVSLPGRLGLLPAHGAAGMAGPVRRHGGVRRQRDEALPRRGLPGDVRRRGQHHRARRWPSRSSSAGRP